MVNHEKTGANLRVLLVEDCENDAMLIERELAKDGSTPLVLRVDSPGSMNQALRSLNWDIVLSDWSLPRFSALFALEMLKCNGLDVPFIIVSGTIGEEAAISAMKAGAHDYIMKSHLGRLGHVIERELLEANGRHSRKRAEVALAAGEERLKFVARATSDAIWDWDLATQVLVWNAGFQALTGFPIQDVEPGVESWYSRVHPEEQERVIAKRFSAINGAGLADTWSDEYRFCRKDGTYAHVLDRGYVLRNEGKAVRAIGAIVDLTKQKQAEAEISLAYERLRDLTLRLERTKEEERTRLARELHDEFGQHLTGLKLDLAALSKRLAKGKATSQSELIGKIRSMAELVDNSIQTVRRVASSLRPSILDDLGLVPALQWQAREFEARSGVPCEATIGPSLSQLELDPDRATALFRIAQELLTNVMRHAHASHVRLVLHEESNCLLLEVSDDGCGISDRQYANPTTLGLRGMQERIALFGGRLNIHGSPGKGTTVQAWMPQPNNHETNRETNRAVSAA